MSRVHKTYTNDTVAKNDRNTYEIVLMFISNEVK